MAKKKTGFDVIDLFCGGGGTFTGIKQAAAQFGLAVNGLAINHWDMAIATHSKNHPEAKHLCASVEAVNPEEVFGRRKRPFLLVASPECTNHSRARGGKPINDQSRASAFAVLNWITRLVPENVIIENVPEFRDWARSTQTCAQAKSTRANTFRTLSARFRKPVTRSNGAS